MGVQVETVEADQDEVEAAAAALKLTDQCDDSDYDSEYSESDTD